MDSTNDKRQVPEAGKMPLRAFLEHCTAAGGNYTKMFLSGILRLAEAGDERFARAWDRLPDGGKIDFPMIIEAVGDALEWPPETAPAPAELETEPDYRCECSDPGCPAHRGRGFCAAAAGSRLLRVDMEDRSGTLMCATCAEDAMATGIFAEEPIFSNQSAGK